MPPWVGESHTYTKHTFNDIFRIARAGYKTQLYIRTLPRLTLNIRPRQAGFIRVYPSAFSRRVLARASTTGRGQARRDGPNKSKQGSIRVLPVHGEKRGLLWCSRYFLMDAARAKHTGAGSVFLRTQMPPGFTLTAVDIHPSATALPNMCRLSVPPKRGDSCVATVLH